MSDCSISRKLSSQAQQFAVHACQKPKKSMIFNVLIAQDFCLDVGNALTLALYVAMQRDFVKVRSTRSATNDQYRPLAIREEPLRGRGYDQTRNALREHEAGRVVGTDAGEARSQGAG